jgi:phosphate transport system substrate-binding protein
MLSSFNRHTLHLLAFSGLLTLAACSGERSANPDQDDSTRSADLGGTVSIDGSSTVYPVTEAVAEEFLAVAPGVRVTVGVSGTGGGFKKFAAGEIDINDASRPIKPSEAADAAANGIDYLAIPVAYDGLSIIVHPDNSWVDYLTVAELQQIWQPGSTVDSWDDIRPEWPAEPIRLYGPGTDSGTFDYFTEAVNGEAGRSRPDYTASEDDNVLVQGITGDQYSLGFFGYAYYMANQSRLKLVPVDGGAGPMLPNDQTIQDGSYSPLSRPIFIYLNKTGAAKPQVRRFAEFYLEIAPEIAHEVGYIALPATEYQKSQQALRAF